MVCRSPNIDKVGQTAGYKKQQKSIEIEEGGKRGERRGKRLIGGSAVEWRSG
jgi:hypothetical protein